MATIQSGGSPGTRIEAGDQVLIAAKAVNIKPVAKRHAAFQKAHAAYRSADDKVQKANEALRTQQSKVAERDVDQDAAVEGLASVLPADGFPRSNPFKPFGAPPPAQVCKMGYAEEAQQVLDIEKAALKHKNTSAASRAAAKKAGLAAKAVLVAMAPIPKLEKARTDAISARNALEQAWETAFAGLKRAALAAEDDGAKGLYAALFERAPKPKSKAKAKAKGKAKDKEEAAETEAEAEAEAEAEEKVAAKGKGGEGKGKGGEEKGQDGEA